MLKKLYRITKEKEFQTIYRRGRYQSTALFSINYLPAKKDITRIGIVVGKKISKKATDRNLIKRRLREISKEIHPNIKGNFDIIITARKLILESEFQKIKEQMINAFKKAGLL